MSQQQARSPKVLWRPHAGPQTRFMRSGVRDIFYGGAAGGGKSVALIAAGCRFLHHPHYRGKIFRKTRTQATELIIKAKRLIPYAFPGAEWRASEFAFIHPNGGRLEFGYLRHDDDLENEQGQEYQFVGFDELTHFPMHQPIYLHGRLRAPEEDNIPLQFKATGNPGGIGHLWVKARYIDPAKPEEVIWEKVVTPLGKTLWSDRMFIPARLEDNPSLGDDYEISLASLDSKTYQALRLGDWDALIGQAFGEWDRNLHRLTWDRFARMHGLILRSDGKVKIPDHWPRFMSFDWGSNKPFSVGWWAADEYGRLYRYDEWYGVAKDRNGRTIPDQGIHLPNREIARGILSREHARGERGKIQLRVADPSVIRNRTQNAEGIPGPTLAEIFAEEGVHMVAADNDRIAGKQQVHDRLRLYDLETPTGIIETPGMFILENCVEWLRCVPVLPIDEKKVEDIDTDAEDHNYDETRYMLMARPWDAKPIISHKRWMKRQQQERKGWKG